MSDGSPSYSNVDDVVEAMIRGEIPTRSEFVCPACAGPARVSASPRGDVVSLSVRCPCSAVEMDGSPKWAGWEVLLTAPELGSEPNPLSLRQGGGGFTTWGLGRAGEAAPCPYCGAPLATSRAKQCFVCGTDWHDPQNVVCRKNPEWNRFGLKWREMYVVELCQDPAGHRYTKYREVSVGAPDPHRVFETTPHPGWQWVAWGHYGYAESVTTTAGGRFTFEAHGIWLTWDEVRALHRSLRGEVRGDEVPWTTGVPPTFPPK